ncbi:MAG: hypothetical protein NZ875_06560 [Pseudothermotoga sp.]|nr:hypothetical protein [Pseudothermotoga sp.]MDW8140058.1 hypothetical protein [Pseudothermotoga sp.]
MKIILFFTIFTLFRENLEQMPIIPQMRVKELVQMPLKTSSID